MKQPKYKLNVSRDIDIDEGVYILNLPKGFKFTFDKVHTAGYDSMAELRGAVRSEIEPCHCVDCIS